MSDSSEERRPLLKIVHGNPTDEELAALVTVLSARSAAVGDAATRRSAWASYWQSHRAPLTPGAGAWRSSALPR